MDLAFGGFYLDKSLDFEGVGGDIEIRSCFF